MQPETLPTNPVYRYLSNAWYIAHKWGLWILIAMACGAWIGISVSRSFYVAKMDEVLMVGGMVHKGKVYTVTPK